MTVPSTADWTLDVDEVLVAAMERLRRQPDAAYEIKVARRALQFVFAKLAAMGINLWTVELRSVSLDLGDADITLAADTQDVLEITLRDTSETTPIDLPLTRIARDDYAYTPDKTSAGRPTRFFVERLRDAPVLHLLMVPDRSTYRLDLWVIRKFRDVGGPLSQLDVPTRWLGLIVAGIAYYLGMSTSGLEPDHRAELKDCWLGELADITPEDRDSSVLTLLPDLSAYSRY